MQLGSENIPDCYLAADMEFVVVNETYQAGAKPSCGGTIVALLADSFMALVLFDYKPTRQQHVEGPGRPVLNAAATPARDTAGVDVAGVEVCGGCRGWWGGGGVGY